MASKVTRIFRNEQFMEDATFSIFKNRIQTLKSREDDYIWSVPVKKIDNKQLKIPEKEAKEHFVNKETGPVANIYTQNKQNFTHVEDGRFLQKQESTIHRSLFVTARTPVDEHGHHRSAILPRYEMKSEDDYFSSVPGKEIKNKQRKTPENENFANKQTTGRVANINTQNMQDDIHVKDGRYLQKLENKIHGSPSVTAHTPVNERGHHRPAILRKDEIKRNNLIEQILPDQKKFNTNTFNSNSTFEDWCVERKNKFKNRCKSEENVRNQAKIMFQKSESEVTGKKRIRHDSGIVVKNKVLKQKSHKKCEKSLCRQDSKTLDNLEETMLCVKIIGTGDEKSCYQPMAKAQDLLRIKKTYPKLAEILPDIDGPRKEASYCATVVNCVLSFLLNPYYKLDGKLDDKMFLELLSATQIWEINSLYDICQKKILTNVHQHNAKEFFVVAHQFQLREIREVCLKLLNKENPLNDTVIRYKRQNSFISVSCYKESLQFPIKLHQTASVLQDNCEKDIKNEIIFEAITGCFEVTGIQVLIEDADNHDINKRMLNLYYNVENLSEKVAVDENEVEKPLRRTILINFNTNLVLKPQQRGKITLQTDIEPCLCSAIEETIIKSKDNQFSLTLWSNFKVNKSEKKRFLIEKVLYFAM